MYMYREQQVGGNCRIHALNAFFQKPQITEELFKKYAENFDELMNSLYHVQVKSIDFDLVNSDQNNVVCYILLLKVFLSKTTKSHVLA